MNVPFAGQVCPACNADKGPDKRNKLLIGLGLALGIPAAILLGAALKSFLACTIFALVLPGLIAYLCGYGRPSKQ